MSCGGVASEYEQFEESLIHANMWKSNFVAIWEKYGTFEYVEGVKCFNYYDIDGDGEGQKRMSKHLKQPTLWQDVMHDDLEWVHLFFNLSKFIYVTPQNIDTWIEDHKLALDDYTFNKLTYTIVDDRVTASGFYEGTTPKSEPFLENLAHLIAERKNVDVSNFTYEETVTHDDVKAMIENVASYGYDASDTVIIYDLPLMKDVIASYLLEKGIGTDLLDELVMDGVLIGVGNVNAGTMTYALPVDVARKMNGFSFVKMVENALEFDYKEESHWYDIFVELIKPILAVIALYFGFYAVALSLVLSFAADVTGNVVFEVLSTLTSLLSGDLTTLVEVGAGEAINLLMNVYALYVDMKFKPEAQSEKEPVEDDKALFFEAPYSAYRELYCYKELVSVSLGQKY